MSYELVKEEKYDEIELDGEKVLARQTIIISRGFTVSTYFTLYRRIGSGFAGVYPSHKSYQMDSLIKDLLEERQFENHLMKNPVLVERLQTKLNEAKKKAEKENEETG
jgi:hypothetical protein